MHPVNFLIEEINRQHWGIPAHRKDDRPERMEVPVRSRFNPFQHLPLGALKRG